LRLRGGGSNPPRNATDQHNLAPVISPNSSTLQEESPLTSTPLTPTAPVSAPAQHNSLSAPSSPDVVSPAHHSLSLQRLPQQQLNVPLQQSVSEHRNWPAQAIDLNFLANLEFPHGPLQPPLTLSAEGVTFTPQQSVPSGPRPRGLLGARRQGRRRQGAKRQSHDLVPFEENDPAIQTTPTIVPFEEETPFRPPASTFLPQETTSRQQFSSVWQQNPAEQQDWLEQRAHFYQQSNTIVPRVPMSLPMTGFQRKTYERQLEHVHKRVQNAIVPLPKKPLGQHPQQHYHFRQQQTNPVWPSQTLRPNVLLIQRPEPQYFASAALEPHEPLSPISPHAELQPPIQRPPPGLCPRSVSSDSWFALLQADGGDLAPEQEEDTDGTVQVAQQDEDKQRTSPSTDSDSTITSHRPDSTTVPLEANADTPPLELDSQDDLPPLTPITPVKSTSTVQSQSGPPSETTVPSSVPVSSNLPFALDFANDFPSSAPSTPTRPAPSTRSQRGPPVASANSRAAVSSTELGNITSRFGNVRLGNSTRRNRGRGNSSRGNSNRGNSRGNSSRGNTSRGNSRGGSGGGSRSVSGSEQTGEGSK
jgi:hypothetical protein